MKDNKSQHQEENSLIEGAKIGAITYSVCAALWVGSIASQVELPFTNTFAEAMVISAGLGIIAGTVKSIHHSLTKVTDVEHNGKIEQKEHLKLV
jgi:hypothetical protein